MRSNLYIKPTTGDITLLNNNLRVTRTLTEFVSQKIENKLKLFEGEFFADQTIGLPYFSRILGKTVDIDDINALYQNEIKSIEEVEEILSFVVDYDGATRKYEISFEVLATSDSVTENVTGEITIP